MSLMDSIYPIIETVFVFAKDMNVVELVKRLRRKTFVIKSTENLTAIPAIINQEYFYKENITVQHVLFKQKVKKQK